MKYKNSSSVSSVSSVSSDGSRDISITELIKRIKNHINNTHPITNEKKFREMLKKLSKNYEDKKGFFQYTLNVLETLKSKSNNENIIEKIYISITLIFANLYMLEYKENRTVEDIYGFNNLLKEAKEGIEPIYKKSLKILKPNDVVSVDDINYVYNYVSDLIWVSHIRIDDPHLLGLPKVEAKFI